MSPLNFKGEKMEFWFYVFYFVLLYSIYKTNFIPLLTNYFTNKNILILLEMFGKVIWGIGVSVAGAFISEILSYAVFLSPGFWLGVILITTGVFIEIKATKMIEIIEKWKGKKMEIAVTGLTILFLIAYCLNSAEKEIKKNIKSKN